MTRAAISPAAGSDSFAYASENLLTAGPGTSLSYDPLLRLYQVANGTTAPRFAYDGLEMIAEYDGSNVLTRRYVYGPRTDEPRLYSLRDLVCGAQDAINENYTLFISGAGIILYTFSAIYLLMFFCTGFMITGSPKKILVICGIVIIGFFVNLLIFIKSRNSEETVPRGYAILSFISSVVVIIPVFVAAFDLIPH